MTGLPWFRAYSRMIDDDKLRLLAFEDRWHFVALCCLKCEALLDEPDSDMRRRRIAVRLGVQVRELEEIGRRLQDVGLVDFDLNPLAWDRLQFKTDKSTERVREWRKKQQKQTRNEVKRFSNVSVTAQETDTDTDTELSPKGDCASGDALKPEHVASKWNEIAGAIGRPKIRDLTPERRQLVRARIAQYGIDDFVTVFEKVTQSPFLRGERNWRGATFDWVVKKANFQKILEGNYDE